MYFISSSLPTTKDRSKPLSVSRSLSVSYPVLISFGLLPETNRVLGTSFGNHVGDWEHTMIRFQDGTPQAIYLSQHDSGIAYTWDAIIKNEQGRPSVYIALGDHACYAVVGHRLLSMIFVTFVSS